MGGDRRYGKFRCRCDRRWSSAHVWDDCGQYCIKCEHLVFPYKQAEWMDVRDGGRHLQDYCQKCRQLDYSCTILPRGRGGMASPSSGGTVAIPIPTSKEVPDCREVADKRGRCPGCCCRCCICCCVLVFLLMLIMLLLYLFLPVHTKESINTWSENWWDRNVKKWE